MKNFTPKQAIVFFRKMFLTFRDGDIQTIRKTHQRSIWLDLRTEYRINNANVYPYALDLHSRRVYVICPYCKRFHVHGIDSNGKYGGMRTAHCHDPDNPNYNIVQI